MNPLFQQVVQDIVRKKLQHQGLNRPIPPRVLADAMRVFRVETYHRLRDYFLIVLGTLSAGFGLKGFLLPNKFIDGGVTGISLLVEVVTGIPLSVLLVAINLPFLVLGAWTISRQFAVRSIIAIVILSLLVHYVPYPVITDDKLLIAIFGGFFLGMGIGLSVRGGAVIDGTEVLAVYVSRKTSLTIGDVILLFNIIIFSFGAYILSVEIALYAILTYLAASKTVDFVIDGIEEYMGVTIISERSDDIRVAITENLGRGCTIYNGKRGYGRDKSQLRHTDIVYTVITRLELAKLQTEVDKIDEEAFMIMSSIKDTRGGMVKKRPLKH
ncbi:MAG: YitT family protein [Lewinellaceae bacterium]|nr:YitT family protein [Lewinellaceae bacterium]